MFEVARSGLGPRASTPTKEVATPATHADSLQCVDSQDLFVTQDLPKSRVSNSQTQTGHTKTVQCSTQTPKSMLATDEVIALRKEVSELKNELFSTKDLLKKIEMTLAFTRTRLAAETVTNLTYQEDFSKVADQISRIQREKVALIREMASLKLSLEATPVEVQKTANQPVTSTVNDVQQQVNSLKTAVDTLTRATGGDQTWTEVVRGSRKSPAKQAAANVASTHIPSSGPKTEKSHSNLSGAQTADTWRRTYLLGASILRHVNPCGLENTTVRSISGATNERFKQELEASDLSNYDNIIIQSSTNNRCSPPVYRKTVVALVKTARAKAPDAKLVLSCV